MKEINVLLVGAGALGQRHLQAIAQINLTTHVTVVEPTAQALALAKSMFNDSANACVSASYFESSEQLSPSTVYDVCVVATGAAVRYQIIERLLEVCSIKSFVLEKILFQNTVDLELANKLLDDKGIPCWVNCPRRMFEGYGILKELLANEDHLNMEVIGSGWGMACNAIHFIDILGYLSGAGDISINLEELEPNVVQSKRAGHLEVLGAIKVFSHNSSELTMRCASGSQEPIRIKIQYSSGFVMIDESQGVFDVYQEGELVSRGNLGVRYQSQLTNEVVASIVESGNCTLTSFEESYKYHYAFLQEMLGFFRRNHDSSLTASPIT